MSGWRFDLDDEGYFSEPVEIKRPESYWKADDDYWVAAAAEQAAEQYHSDHDGWESDWPVTFRIYPPDSNAFVLVEVEREAVPEFIGQIKRESGE